MTFWSGKEPYCNLNEDKLPLLDFYLSWSGLWRFKSRSGKYTGEIFKHFLLQIIIFRVAYTWSLDYDKKTICPVIVKLEHRKQRAKNV